MKKNSLKPTEARISNEIEMLKIVQSIYSLDLVFGQKQNWIPEVACLVKTWAFSSEKKSRLEFFLTFLPEFDHQPNKDVLLGFWHLDTSKVRSEIDQVKLVFLD